MRVFAASMAAETNTFAAIPTGQASFEEFGLFRGDGSMCDPQGVGAYVADIRRMAEADGHEVRESIAAFAQPAGRIVQSVYQGLRDALLEDLKSAMPVDIVQLMLHGAMAADAIDDCEGNILWHVRQIVGPDVAVGVELDLHCHFTELMHRNADAIVSFKEYPHTDGRERAEELYQLLVACRQGRIRPVTAVANCPMVGLFHTTREPMASFVKRMQSFEGHSGVLSVSLGHGFPWADVAEGGAKLWVITDNDLRLADALARQLALEFWALRERIRIEAIGIDEALDRAAGSKAGPVVLADMADNPGGGAPGDSTFILARMIERGIGDAVIGGIWDMAAVRICQVAGIGATLDLRIGGKSGPVSGAPIDVRVTVRAIVEAHSQKTYDGRAPFGASAWVETEAGIAILLVSVRNQIMGRDDFTGMGMRLDDRQIIVVKSAQHFYADFAPIAAEVHYVSTPGAVPPDFATIDYKVRSLDYWPREACPSIMPPCLEA